MRKADTVVPLKPPKMWKSNVTIFTHVGQKATVYVPDGCSIALLIRGEKVVVHDLDGMGQYEVDTPENCGNSWPVACCVIDRAHSVAWSNLKESEIERILDRCGRVVERRRAGLPTENGNIFP